MKARIALAVAVTLIMVSSASVAADSAVVPFRAFYAMLPQIVGVDEQGCNIQKLPGEGQATHLGKSTWYSDAKACIFPPTMTGAQYGSSIFTAANGDQLIGTFSGVGAIVMTPSGPQALFSGTAYVTEGTGRFAGYTGTLNYWGTAWLATVPMTGELYFDGTLTKPERP
jgi:hypothetical protein